MFKFPVRIRRIWTFPYLPLFFIGIRLSPGVIESGIGVWDSSYERISDDMTEDVPSSKVSPFL